jgi:YjbR
MTANDFRKMALALPETEEHSHMNHPDFRVAGKIFATLGYPDKTRGMVKLSPEEALLFQGSSRRVYPGDGRLGTPRSNQRPAQNRKEKTPPGSHPRRLELQRPKAPAGEREWVI